MNDIMNELANYMTENMPYLVCTPESISEAAKETRKYAGGLANDLLLQGCIGIDTETTGLSKNDEIVSVSVVDTDGAILFSSLLKPSRPIPMAATKIHGIRNEDVVNAPTFPEIWNKLSEITSGKKIFAYNAPFDRRMLRQTARIHGVKVHDGYKRPRWADVMGIVSLYIFSMKYIKLSDAARLLAGYDGNDRLHASMEDARVMVDVIKSMANNVAVDFPPKEIPNSDEFEVINDHIISRRVLSFLYNDNYYEVVPRFAFVDYHGLPYMVSDKADDWLTFRVDYMKL